MKEAYATHLPLNISQIVLEQAETYAKHSQKTLSQMVEEYISLIALKSTGKETPITDQIADVIDHDVIIDYKTFLTDTLVEKYI